MKDFNFKTFQDWFNKNYNKDYFRLDGGEFPDDGEVGIYKEGYEISQLVYPEGLSIGDFDPALAFPILQTTGVKPKPDFKPEILPEFKDKIDKNDLIYMHNVSVFHHELILVPFMEKYLSLFEETAINCTGIEPEISLLDYINHDD